MAANIKYGRREPAGSGGGYTRARGYLHTEYTNLQTKAESVYQGLNPHTLEMLDKRHDEKLCILLQTVDDWFRHRVVRKVMRRTISSSWVWAMTMTMT